MAQRLSTMLPCPVMMLFTYDDDYWGYFLWYRRVERDHFHSCPDYFGPVMPPKKPGNVAIMAETFGVESQAIESYLRPWETAKIGCLDNEKGSAVTEYCEQLESFMAALGFEISLLK